MSNKSARLEQNNDPLEIVMQNNTALSYPTLNSPDPTQDIPTRFRYVAHCLPAHPAIEDETGVTSYATLDARSDHLAAHLAKRFGIAPEPVALLLPRAVLSAIGMLGVLKAGKFYVPLDPDITASAQRLVFQASTARILLTSTPLMPLATSLAAPETQVVVIDTLDLTQNLVTPVPVLTPEHYASLSFTSGSTGEPKGIIWHHSGWLNRTRLHALYDHFGPGDRVGQVVSPAFVLALTITLSTLLNGATLVYHPNPHVVLHELFDWLADRTITIFFAPVSLLRDLLAANHPLTKLPCLRSLLLGGQTIFTHELMRLPELVSRDCVISNRLSMSELSWVTRYVIQPRDIKPTVEPVPVGYACDGNDITILDEQGNPTSPGQLGQIVVQSRYLSPGYWHNPELTAQKFLPDPTGGDRRILLTGDVGLLRPDGCLEYHGRQDFMVKIRGYRVEPEAIQAALLSHPAIHECVVTTNLGRDGEARLIAYLAPRAMPGPSTSILRDWLAQSLPSYMIPARFVLLPQLPRNANDKIDRRALPPPGRARPELHTPYVAPRTETESHIAALWNELLDLDQVGIHDNFFALGGDSLLAMNLVLDIEKQFQRPVPADYFREPTIAALAACVSDEKNLSASNPGNPASTFVAPSKNLVVPNPWQDRLARLKTRQVSLGMILRWIIREISLRLPFFIAVHWLSWWFQQRITSRWLYQSERARFKRMTASLGSPDAASEQAFRTRMLSNAIWMNVGQWQGVLLKPGGFLNAMRNSRHLFWRSFVQAVEHAKERERERIIVFQGLENVEQARAQGRGIILVTYHSPAGSIATSILAQYTNLGSILTISPAVANWLIESEEPTFEQGMDMNQIAMATTVGMQGQRVLQAGGIVQVYNDVNLRDATTLVFPIGEREYDFKTGFAELALSTNAVIIPVYSTHEWPGRIRMVFLAPLQQCENADHQTQVRHLVAQYAKFLEHSWRTVPESISWFILQHHLGRPLASPHDKI